MTANCVRCRQTFEITSDDLQFYDHISPVFGGKKYRIPPPTHCPECRLRRRMAFRNQTALYQRDASPAGQTIYSMYPTLAPFPVMRNEDWFSDQWNALEYGQPFSFKKPFMQQLYSLHAAVPRYAAINSIRTENCEYSNNLSDAKNCYLSFSLSNAEDCMYSESCWGSRDCVECTNTIDSELCYDCTNCTRCFNVQSSFNSEDCVDSYFLGNCGSCCNCFACVNVFHREYCIGNEQKTRKEYEQFMKQFEGSSYRERERYRKGWQDMMLHHPRPHTIMHQTENCTGNCILQSRNVHESNFIQYGENLKYCFNLYDHTNDCMDVSFFGRSAELIYECCTCGINISRLCFCFTCRNQSSDLFYCISCDGCKNCFGCVGLWKKEYCVFNVQYTKEEYEALVPKIIEHMSATKEWGEFFPSEFDPMPYNRSIASRYFPLNKEDALREKYLWYEEDPKEFPGAIDAQSLPDRLPAESIPLTVRSAVSQRPFRITTQEIDRYHALRVPLPRMAYEERMDSRMHLLGGVRLFPRTCAKTGKAILTNYPPDSPYIIWDRDVWEQEFRG